MSLYEYRSIKIYGICRERDMTQTNLDLTQTEKQVIERFDKRFPCLVKPVAYSFKDGVIKEVEGMAYVKDDVIAFLIQAIRDARCERDREIENKLTILKINHFFKSAEKEQSRHDLLCAYCSGINSSILTTLKGNHEKP